MFPQRHPNLTPFLAVAAQLDTPSANVSHVVDYSKEEISPGKKIIFPKEMVDRRIPTLAAMAVQALTEPENGHPPFSISTHRRKIGFIDLAWTSERSLHIAGLIYGHDFPDVLAKIREGELGCCLQWIDVANRESVDDSTEKVTDAIFTGLNILDRAKVAFPQTNIRLLTWEQHEELRCQRQ